RPDGPAAVRAGAHQARGARRGGDRGGAAAGARRLDYRRRCGHRPSVSRRHRTEPRRDCPRHPDLPLVRLSDRAPGNAQAAPLVLSLLSISLIIGVSEVWGQSVMPPTELHRNVPRDTEARVISHMRWRDRHGICTTSYVPTLELVIPPKHGAVRFETSTGLSPA